MNEPDLKQFGSAIMRVMAGRHLSRDEARGFFSEILTGQQPDLQQGALLAVLAMKGETPEEIVGIQEAIDQHDTVQVDDLPDPLMENSGTGMDRLKTFNASSAAAIIAAAGGVTMARHGARALSSVCGTVDILEACGLDVECDVATVAHSIRTVGIGLFNGMSPAVHPGALGRILSQIRFGSTLNIAASLANPAHPRLAVRGVGNAAQLDSVPVAMHMMGYGRGIVLHGLNDSGSEGMDEVSVCGPTHIRQFDESGRITKYEILPETLGLARVHPADIAPMGNLHDEAIRFVRVLSGKGDGACVDFAIANAAAVLLVAEKVASWQDGVARARQILQSGAALETLHAWVRTQHRQPTIGETCLRDMCKEAGVSLI